MVEYPGVHLRVTPESIPRLRAAFERAYAMLEPEISALGRYGVLDGAWLGDPMEQEYQRNEERTGAQFDEGAL